MKEILEVKAQGDQLVWKVNAEIKPNTEVFAHGGVQGIVVYDGAPLDHIAPGERKTINTKRLFERKNSGVFELYGVNTGKLIELNWGTRNSPVYRDEDYGVVLQVKSYGRCTVRVENPYTLFQLMSSTGEALTENGLREDIAEKMSAVGTETVAATANELKKKSAIEAAGAKIAQAMTARFKRSFYNDYGLNVEDSVVLGIRVVGAEEIDEKGRQVVVAKLDTELSEENKRQELNEVEVIKGLHEATAKPLSAEKPKNFNRPNDKTYGKSEKREEKKKAKYCTACGSALLADAKYCSNCGKEL